MWSGRITYHTVFYLLLLPSVELSSLLSLEKQRVVLWHNCCCWFITHLFVAVAVAVAVALSFICMVIFAVASVRFGCCYESVLV